MLPAATKNSPSGSDILYCSWLVYHQNDLCGIFIETLNKIMYGRPQFS